MGVTVRPLVPADRAAILELVAATGAFSPRELDAAAEILDASLTCADYPTFVAETDGQVCGYVCVSRAVLSESSWYLYWICVHPRWQRQGIGRGLAEYAEAFVRAHGGTRLVLETSGRPDYAGTRRFYLEAGYRQAGVVPDFYRPGDDLVIYWKPFDRFEHTDARNI